MIRILFFWHCKLFDISLWRSWEFYLLSLKSNSFTRICLGIDCSGYIFPSIKWVLSVCRFGYFPISGKISWLKFRNTSSAQFFCFYIKDSNNRDIIPSLSPISIFSLWPYLLLSYVISHSLHCFPDFPQYPLLNFYLNLFSLGCFVTYLFQR